VGEDPVDHLGLGSEGDDAHLVATAGAPEWVDLEETAQHSPF
jgi:hypothetical protein